MSRIYTSYINTMFFLTEQIQFKMPLSSKLSSCLFISLLYYIYKTKHFTEHISLYQEGKRIHKKIDGVNYIRVRVVRVEQPVCRVYGVDTGSCHQCRARELVLLPASIISLPPCGRLARLPGSIF